VTHGDSWTTLFFTKRSSVFTRHGLGRDCAVCNPHASHLPSLSQCRRQLLCQKCESFFVDPVVESQWTLLLGYLEQVLAANWPWNTLQKTSVSFSKTAHRRIVPAIQSNCRSAKFSTPFLLSWTPLITRFMVSYSNVNMIFELLRLKKSSSNWLKSSSNAAFEWKDMQFWCFHVFPCTA